MEVSTAINQTIHDSTHIEFEPKPIINEKFCVSSFPKISKMNHKLTSLIRGFIKSLNAAKLNQNIAEIIIFQIIAYCSISGCFTKINEQYLWSNIMHGSSIKFNRIKRIIENNGFCTWNSAYLGIKIIPKQNNTYIVKFIIHSKNTSHSDGNGIYLGIAEYDNHLCYEANFTWSKDRYFAYCSNGMAYSFKENNANFMESYSAGDTVWMKIDFDVSKNHDFGTIYFKKNECDQWCNIQECKIEKDQDLIFDIAISSYSSPSGGASQVELEGVWMKEPVNS